MWYLAMSMSLSSSESSRKYPFPNSWMAVEQFHFSMKGWGEEKGDKNVVVCGGLMGRFSRSDVLDLQVMDRAHILLPYELSCLITGGAELKNHTRNKDTPDEIFETSKDIHIELKPLSEPLLYRCIHFLFC